jgi:flavin-dependent dehydrogenase
MTRRIKIAGGGLAGLSLGIALLKRGVAVELHEALAYPRHRVCGEFISGVSDGTLGNLGIAPALADAERLATASWHDGRGLVSEMEVRGLGISRWDLDGRLRCGFENLGGVLHTGARISAGEGIVWAAGRPRARGSWIGLKCHFRGLELRRDLEMFAAPGGYLGLARIGNGVVNACGLFTGRHSNGSKGPEMLIGILESMGLGNLAGRLRNAEADAGSFCGVAGFQPGSQRGPAFSIGDAAWMIPPFTGNGMTMAFESAECALQPAWDYALGKSDWDSAAKAVERSQRRRFRKRMVAAMGLHVFLTVPLALRTVLALARRRCVPFQTLLQLVR